MIKLALLAMIKPLVGGQAVVDGVAMRLYENFSVAIRKQNNKIEIYERKWISFSKNNVCLKWPFVRGIVALLEGIYNGTSVLQFSTDQALGISNKGQGSDNQFDWTLIVTIISCLFLGTMFFKFIPHMAVYLLGQWLEQKQNIALPVTSIWFHLLDGGIKIILFILYIFVISTIKDVKNIFKYHGAEHKSVHVFESDLPLTVQYAQMQSRIHPRCGTSLILLTIMISIFLFSLLLPNIPIISNDVLIQNLFLMMLKIPLMFPIAGLAYEIQKISMKNQNKLLFQILVLPGTIMQKLTTKEPTSDQLEVALAALKSVIERAAKSKVHRT